MTPSSRRIRRHAFAWAVLVLAAIWGAWFWWRLGRPVAVPDAPSARMECVSYAPFRRPGATPLVPGTVVTPAEIDQDLKILSRRFNCVRTYSQGNGLSVVPEIAKRYGMHVLLGIWLSSDRVANAGEIAAGIRTALAHPHTVRAIVVGNEVLLRGDLPPARLVRYIREVRDATHMPVTYADVWEFWLRYGHQAGLEQAVSFITVHILPYWEDRPVPIERALAHVRGVYGRVQRAFPGKPVLIGETGWPSEGKSRWGTVPSRVNEATYVREFLRYADESHVPYNLIEAFDQPWKRAQEGTVGGYWGLYDASGHAKFALRGPVVEAPRWWLGWLAAGAGGLLFAVLAGGGWRRRTAGFAAGIATGAALAEAGREMYYAFSSPLEWTAGIVVCVAGLATALACIRRVGAWLEVADAAVETRSATGWRWLAACASQRTHFLWLVALGYVDLLQVFDGRYRDYPSTAFLVPAVALCLRWLTAAQGELRGRAEGRLLSLWAVGAAVFLLVHAHAANGSVWSWAICNVLLAAPLLMAWARQRVELPARKAQYADQ